MMTCKGDDVTDVGIDPEVTKTTTVEMIEVARRGVRGLRRMCAEVSLKLGLMLVFHVLLTFVHWSVFAAGGAAIAPPQCILEEKPVLDPSTGFENM